MALVFSKTNYKNGNGETEKPYYDYTRDDLPDTAYVWYNEDPEEVPDGLIKMRKWCIRMNFNKLNEMGNDIYNFQCISNNGADMLRMLIEQTQY